MRIYVSYNKRFQCDVFAFGSYAPEARRWAPMKLTATTLLLLLSGMAYAEPEKQALPADVLAFIERRDMCDHFRGEEPYDEERRAFLEQNMTELCTGSDRSLAELKAKYRGNEPVEAALGGYEVDIETGQ